MANLEITNNVSTLEVNDYFDRDGELRLSVSNVEYEEIYLKKKDVELLITHLQKVLDKY